MRVKIQTKVGLTIFGVLAVIMCVLIGATYLFASRTVIAYLEELAESSIARVKINIARPLKEGQVEQALQLIGSETVDRRVYAVLIKKEGSQEVFAGVLKGGDDKEWRAVNKESDVTDECVKRTEAIELNGEKLGTVDLYVSKRYVSNKLRSILGMMALINSLMSLVLLTALFFSIRRIVIRPLNAVNKVMEGIAQGEGDLTVRIRMQHTDEIGEIAQNFNTFVKKIQGLVIQVKEGAEMLASSTSQISATASELSASSVEASSTLSQVTTTAEEIKQTSMVASEKAELVAQNAEAATRVSEDGRKATDQTADGMKRIKEEMEYIAESIVKLSEHSQSIGEIIGAVNDLANESNLLSVNASIEAAKAGEFGKGFGIVAQEVKSLSEQSKQATGQVKAILNDIQNSTSAAVMAMERGVKAVEAGESLAARSGNAIQDLAASVDQSSQSAMQISASSQQQLLGLDQLTTAMESIRIASVQNADGAQQLEQATAQLHELGQAMKDIAEKFKVA